MIAHQAVVAIPGQGCRGPAVVGDAGKVAVGVVGVAVAVDGGGEELVVDVVTVGARAPVAGLAGEPSGQIVGVGGILRGVPWLLMSLWIDTMRPWRS